MCQSDCVIRTSYSVRKERAAYNTRRDCDRIRLQKGTCKDYEMFIKSNEYAKEAGGEIVMIKKLLVKIKFNVVLKLVKGHEEEIE